VSGKEEVLEAIGGVGVVGIFRTPTAEGVLEACRALLDSGVQAVEITLTIPGALALIRSVAKELGDSLAVGAGTVLDVGSCRAAVAAGASFVVSPGLDTQVVAACERLDVVCAPGCLTPTEVISALRAGADLIKLFPARAATPAYLADLLGPLPGARLMPTGAIGVDLAGEFIRHGAFAVGVGTALIPAEAVGSRDEAAIGRAARKLLSTVADSRSRVRR
jgi:2-dehydro-3-deoxyphosphogluconate aldolase/(4S)-4-hydroxy-2-oxoglutarate aldolase